MRVFDTFIYNIVDKVKFKDTKPYIDKMLSELKLKYDSVIFTINEYMTDYDTILAKYPELEKYRYYYEPYGMGEEAHFKERLEELRKFKGQE